VRGPHGALLIVVLAAFAASCGDEASFGASAIELGGATPAGTGFSVLAGDTELVPGAQGGFHVWLKVRVRGVTPGRARMTHTARRKSDGRLPVKGERLVEVGASSMTLSGYEHPEPIPAFMCPSPLGTRVMDEEVSFVVTVTDLAGTPLAETKATATPRCPTGEHAAFCARICTG